MGPNRVQIARLAGTAVLRQRRVFRVPLASGRRPLLGTPAALLTAPQARTVSQARQYLQLAQGGGTVQLQASHPRVVPAHARRGSSVLLGRHNRCRAQPVDMVARHHWIHHRAARSVPPVSTLRRARVSRFWGSESGRAVRLSNYYDWHLLSSYHRILLPC